MNLGNIARKDKKKEEETFDKPKQFKYWYSTEDINVEFFPKLLFFILLIRTYVIKKNNINNNQIKNFTNSSNGGHN